MVLKGLIYGYGFKQCHMTGVTVCPYGFTIIMQFMVSYSFPFNSYLKQLYINNKTECFSNKNGCGAMHIEAFKRRASLGYRQTALGTSNIMLFETVIPLRN